MKEKRELKIFDGSRAFLLAFLLSQLAILFGQLIVQSILALCHFGSERMANFFHTSVGYMLLAIFQCAAFVGLFLYYFKKTNIKDDCLEKKLSPKSLIVFLIFGIITMFGLSNLINFFSLDLALLGLGSKTIEYRLDGALDYFISIISLAILPSIGEELLFRGIIFNSFKKKGPYFALIMSSVLFMIFHFNLYQLLYPILFGLILGFAMMITKNIIVCISIHFFNNFINLTLQYFTNFSSFKVNAISIIITFIGIVIYLAILVLLHFYANKNILVKASNIDENKNSTNLISDEKNLNISSSYNKNTITSNSTLERNKNEKASFSFRGLIYNEKFQFLWPILLMAFLYIIIIITGA